MVKKCTLAVALSLTAADARAGELDREEIAELLAELQSLDAEDRAAAADELADDGPPPPVAIPLLLRAAEHERDRLAFAKVLVALGRSGVMEARVYLDAHVLSPDEEIS
jgi:hypothetical protein